MQEVRRERLAATDGLFAKAWPMKSINEYLGLELPSLKGGVAGYIPINLTQVGAPEAELLAPVDYSEPDPSADDDDATPEPVKGLPGVATPEVQTRQKASTKNFGRARCASAPRASKCMNPAPAK